MWGEHLDVWRSIEIRTEHLIDIQELKGHSWFPGTYLKGFFTFCFFLLSVLTHLGSVGLEVIIPKGSMFPSGETTRILLNFLTKLAVWDPHAKGPAVQTDSPSHRYKLSCHIKDVGLQLHNGGKKRIYLPFR